MLLLIRLLVGYFLQSFPFGLLCIYAFRDHYRFRSRQTYLILSGGTLLLSTIFSTLCILLYKYSIIPQKDLFFAANLLFMATMIPCLLMYIYLTRGIFSKNLFVFLFAAFVINSFNNIICSHLSRHMTADGLPYDNVSIPMILLCTLLFIPPLLFLLHHKFIPLCDFLDPKEYRQLCQLALVLFLILIFEFFPMSDGRIYNRTILYLYIALILCTFMIYFIFFQIFAREKKRFEAQKQLEETTRQLELQQTYYQNMIKNTEETRRMRHDFRQHLIVLQGYAMAGNTQGLVEYLSDHIRQIDHLATPSYSNLPVVNMLLHHYRLLCQEKEIRMDISATPIPSTGLSDSELATLLGNLLENAYTAADHALPGNRSITVRLAVHGNMLVITIDNGFDGNVNKKRDHYLSTKVSHTGYGLRSIRHICDTHGGNCSFSHDTDCFHSSAVIAIDPD